MSINYKQWIDHTPKGVQTRCEFEFMAPLVLFPRDKLNIVFIQTLTSAGSGMDVTHYVERAEGNSDETENCSYSDLLLRELPEMGCWSFLPDAFKYRVMALINKEQA